jgi:large subunit ribosomal protein L18
MSNNMSNFERRKQRVRRKLKKVSSISYRLSVFRSNNHVYAQIIDDSKGGTVVAASTNEKDLRVNRLGSNKESATKIGQLVAERALKQNIKEVVFDRGGYIYHGKIKALADAAREAGLKF